MMERRYARRVEHLGVLLLVVILTGLFITAHIPIYGVFAFEIESNQAPVQGNDCGNGPLPISVGCNNIGMEVQGDLNGIALSAEQEFPSSDVSLKLTADA